MPKALLHALDPLVSTPNYAKNSTEWVLPFEGTMSHMVGQDYIKDAMPTKYAVTAVQYKQSKYDKTKDAFVWADGEHQFVTWYWGDSIFETIVALDDGLYATFSVDTYCKEWDGTLGDAIADTIIRALEKENEYEHIIVFDEYGNEHISRGRRIPEKVPMDQLLNEKEWHEKMIRRFSEKVKNAESERAYNMFVNAIIGHEKSIAELNAMIAAKK